MASDDGCGAPAQAPVTGEDVGDQIVVAGKVTSSGSPAGGAYVRLLNADGEFAGEVQASDGGDFRFYAAPGSWTVRALHRDGNGQAGVSAEGPGLHEVAVTVG
jgi:FtsP/CotA-like multicopper oxidase with cupredoxin domain